MSKLYEKCSLCKGTTILQGGEHCFGCKGVGFTEIGLTSRQVERAVNCERRRIGDPSAPAPDLVVDAAGELLEACLEIKRVALEEMGFRTYAKVEQGAIDKVLSAIAKAAGEGKS